MSLRAIGAAIVRGPIVHDESGRPRARVRPSAREFVLALVVTATAMIVLYSGLDGRNKALLASGAPFFSPELPLDVGISLVPILVWPYYSYFFLLFFFSVLTIRDRRVMYEGVVGYLGCAAVSFLIFWLLPSRMVQPDISACRTTACRMLDAMYQLDDGFNIFPSLHVGYSTLVWLFYRRYMPELTRAVGAIVFAIVLSTLLCKRHYFVDIPAGVVMASAVFALSKVLGARMAHALRWLGPAMVLVGFVALPAVAQADDPQPQAAPPAAVLPPSRITHSTQGAVITRPGGAYVRHDVRYRLGDSGVRVGLFDSFLSVSNEIGSSISYATVPEWVSLQAEIAAEPGFYLQTPTADARTLGVRTVARFQANLNLRFLRFWLYGRTTAGLRLRNFDERDPFRDLLLRREAWVEQATALLVRVNDPPPGKAAFWVYGEYTVGRVTSTGSPAATTAVTMPNRVSGGVISENFLAKGLFIDVDLFWSLAPAPTDGFGTIVAFWIGWP